MVPDIAQGTQLLSTVAMTVGVATTFQLPDITSDMWSYASLLLTWPPLLAILSVTIGLGIAAVVGSKVMEMMTRRN